MPYTQEQVEQAKQEGQLLVDIYGSAHGQIFFCENDGNKHDIGAIVKTLLAALKDEQQMTDKAMEQYDRELEKNYNLEAYATKLERAGDLMADCHTTIYSRQWDAARKDKP